MTRKNQQPKLPAIALCIIMGISFCVFMVLLLQGPSSEQWNVFFRRGEDNFRDFYNVCRYILESNPYDVPIEAAAERAYPPMAYLLMKPFSSSIINGTQSMQTILVFIYSFGLFGLLFFALYSLKTGGSIARWSSVGALYLSGIFLFSFERGNIITFAVVGVVFFLCYHNSSSPYMRHVAYISLALAASIKVYPAILGVLLIFKRRYKDAAILVIYGAILSFLPFVCFEGGMNNLSLLFRNIEISTNVYRIGNFPRFGLSYLLPLSGEYQGSFIAIMEKITLFLSVLSLGCAYFNKAYWKQCSLILCVLVYLPVNSALYSGLYMFPAIILFLNNFDEVKAKTKILNIIYLSCLLVFLFPFYINNIGHYAANWSLLLFWLLLLTEGLYSVIIVLRQKVSHHYNKSGDML